MRTVQYYTEAAVAELKEGVSERIDWYLKGSGSSPEWISCQHPVRKTTIPMNPIVSTLKTKGRNPAKHDAPNAIEIYKALCRLTLHQASDERLWTYICHNDCRAYVAKRWLADDALRDQMEKRVASHYFVKGTRGLIRDNGISRLWWLGHIAHQVAPGEPDRFLEVVLFRQDTRSALIERPSVSRNYGVLGAIYSAMKKDYETKDRALFQRETFRAWMKALNRQGGMVLLDALSKSQLERLVNEQANKAMRTVGEAK